MDQLLKALYVSHLTATLGFGPNQFAYTKKRGARDALAMLTTVWIESLAAGRKVAIYCSDVSGAFELVKMGRLVAKLHAKKIHPNIVAVLVSWLRQRAAHIIVGGQQSEEMVLRDMVFQRTVIGPDLWNSFFEDARQAINECFFTEVVYADDLNAYRVFGHDVDETIVMKSIDACQTELHTWGRTNQVAFGPANESKHILSLTHPVGNAFKLLGVWFDGTLAIGETIAEIIHEAGWKLKTMQRTRWYYNDADLVLLYKAHVLSYLEFCTPAIYHATR